MLGFGMGNLDDSTMEPLAEVRHKAPGQQRSILSTFPVRATPQPVARTSDDFRWALAMAGVGMLLRDAPDRGAVTWAAVEALANRAVGTDVAGYRKDALAVIAGARALATAP